MQRNETVINIGTYVRGREAGAALVAEFPAHWPVGWAAMVEWRDTGLVSDLFLFGYWRGIVASIGADYAMAVTS